MEAKVVHGNPFLLLAALAATGVALAANPILPLWEYMPDGEPYVFDDPDNPGKKRVYLWICGITEVSIRRFPQIELAQNVTQDVDLLVRI